MHSVSPSPSQSRYQIPFNQLKPSSSSSSPNFIRTKNYAAHYMIRCYRDKMADSSAAYIHMVQHLIEKCLIFHMNKEECVEALSKHANISPIITSTVWKELEKENREFFEAYAESRGKNDRILAEEETSRLIQKMISKDSDD